MLKPLPRLYRWLRRLSHRRGYGIHSPFAFQLVTRVVYESGTFCAYAGPDAERRDARLLRKDDRLLLRLANDHRPDAIIAVGQQTDCSARYLAAGCRTATLTQLTADDPSDAARALREQGGAVLLFIDAGRRWPDIVSALLPHLTPQTLLVVRGIHHRPSLTREWKKLLRDPRTGITFDLGRLGLLYAPSERTKQHYVVNYL